MSDSVALLAALAVAFLTMLGVANAVGKNGAAQTKAQSWIAIAIGIVVFFVVFSALRHK